MAQEKKEVVHAETFDVSSLILGFTGSLGSGCTFLAEGVGEVLGDEGHYYRVSEFLREEAKGNSCETSVLSLQSIGDELRREYGLHVLIERCKQKTEKDVSNSVFQQCENTVILIDGIKNEGEIKYLRQFPNFYLISVHADKSLRQQRIIGESAALKRFNTNEEFDKADRRDADEDLLHGQQIKKCNYLADIIFNNHKKIEDTQELDRKQYFQKFVDDYIYPMRKVRKGESAHDRPPKVEETIMTTAYCASKRSSCLKRKVGAVIAYIRNINKEYPDATIDSSDRDIPFQIVSVGYNDVPLGKPCLFSDWKKCYRDHLQEIHAGRVKKCWHCGWELPDKIQCVHCNEENQLRTLKCKKCNHDLLSDFECKSCQSKIFSICLPGGEGMPGKLLDMCRALHAEENAILALAGIGKMGNGELVLYTTTFPCNLCANKIIASGIKTVYYAEPYTMSESQELLEKCGVKVEKFEGIKSTAYFRLYA